MTDRRMFYEYGDLVDQVPWPPAARALRAPVATATSGDLARFSAFFTDLDSYTEYWDLYRPELQGKYMSHVRTVFNGVLRDWFNYALREQTPEAPQLWSQLATAVAVPRTAAALGELDALQRTLLERHFPAAGGGIDGEPYFQAVAAFARDLLPSDDDRLARTPPDDSRHEYAGRHRMDGPSMWFSWAGVSDCASLLPSAGGAWPHRALLVGAAAFGSAMDFTFRGQAGFRGKTRQDYRPDDATAARLQRDVRTWTESLETARAQAMELFRIFRAP